MAQKKSTDSNKTKVRRIKATDDGPKKPKSVAAKKTTKEVKKATTPKAKKTEKATTQKTKKVERVDIKPEPKGMFGAIGGYFKGAWAELKQVRWPNRAATWSMTLAVLLFTGIFIVLILLLDAGFRTLFEGILK